MTEENHEHPFDPVEYALLDERVKRLEGYWKVAKLFIIWLGSTIVGGALIAVGTFLGNSLFQ